MVTQLPYAKTLFTVLLMLGQAAVAAGAAESHDVAILLKQLSDPEGTRSSVAHIQLARLRETVIERLLVLADAKAPETAAKAMKCRAIQLLGQWRAAEATELLVNEIEYPEFMITRSALDVAPLDYYPSARSLVSIGGPAAEKIIERMAKPVNETELKLFAFVIQEIDGTELGRARLELALAKAEKKEKKKGTKPPPRPEEAVRPRELEPEETPEEKGPREELQRENLSRLLQLYKKLDFDSIEDWPLPEPVKQKFKGYRRTPIRE